MKKHFSLIILFLSSLSLTAQVFKQVKGNGDVITVEREVQGDFHSLFASNGVDVYLTPGNENKISVEADSNLHEAIVTKIKNSKLSITTNTNIGRRKRLKVHVTYKTLNQLEAQAGADIESRGELKSQELELLCSSGGDIDIHVLSEYITASVSSGGEIELKGRSINLEANASSGGEFDGKDLNVLHAVVKASSGGAIKINSKESLKANAGSGGKVEYYGNPTETDIQSGFSGVIKKKN